jgi:hypothetical protein
MEEESWRFRPAKWYQFWLPQSGLFGGIIIGAVISAAVVSLWLICGRG